MLKYLVLFILSSAFSLALTPVVRRVRSNGAIKWRGRRVFVSEALIGEPVGLQEVDQDLWRIEFGPIPLALYHSPTEQFTRLYTPVNHQKLLPMFPV